jgi:hypothetical protein
VIMLLLLPSRTLLPGHLGVRKIKLATATLSAVGRTVPHASNQPKSASLALAAIPTLACLLVFKVLPNPP